MIFSHFSRPQWLFFDLDDTLWDFKKNSQESLRHVFYLFKEINVAFSSFDDFLSTYHFHNSALWEDFALGKISSDLLKSERWRRTLFPDSNQAQPPSMCMTIDSEYLRCLAMQPFLVEGAQEMLRSLSKDYMLAVLSNGFIDTQYYKLQHSGLWRFITRTVVSDEAKAQKPDPRLFEYAVNATGASSTPVMIGDNPFTDIIGALRAGWNAIWYNPKGDKFPFSVNELKAQGVQPDLLIGEAANAKEIEHLIRKGS